MKSSIVQLFKHGPSPEVAAETLRQRAALWSMARRLEATALRGAIVELHFATQTEAAHFLEICASVRKRRKPSS